MLAKRVKGWIDCPGGEYEEIEQYYVPPNLPTGDLLLEAYNKNWFCIIF